MDVMLDRLSRGMGDDRPIEIVERKGLGHPDTICDFVAERLSRALCRFYLDNHGAILHHNVDKALLYAGASTPRFGGGVLTAPIEIYLSGRAVAEAGGRAVPLVELTEEAVREFVREHFHVLNPDQDVVARCLVRPGAIELREMFAAGAGGDAPLANDTSCGVGYAPLSTLERVVLAVERRLNQPDVRASAPAIGQDIKVMGLRRGDRIALTVAAAIVDRFTADARAYEAARADIADRVRREAASFTTQPVEVAVNTADDPAAGRYYLTVTGTSAEAGDDGQAGRGNRANGLITPFRPMTIESVAGKNPISHVGKLYSILAGDMAEAIVDEVLPVRGATCYLVSQIGHPINDPKVVTVGVALADGVEIADIAEPVEAVIADQLAGVTSLWRRLINGEVPFY